MGTPYYEIKYLNSDGTQSVRTYTYFSRKDLALGKKVIAPTFKNEKQVGVVFAVNVPEPGFPCKEITEIIPEEEDDA